MGNFLGNVISTASEQNPRREQASVRSWAEVLEQTAEAAEERRSVRENEARNRLNQKAKVTKPQKVQKLVSLQADNFKIEINDKFSMGFVIDAKTAGKAVICISQKSSFDACLFKEESSFEEGLGQKKIMQNDKKNELIIGKEYFLKITLVPSKIEPNENAAENEVSCYRFKVKSNNTVSFDLEKRSVLFKDKEYTYKSWYGAEPGNNNNEDENLCVVCLENKISTLISPCLHKCVCETCAKMLSEQKSHCPLCRSSVAEFWVVDA